MTNNQTLRLRVASAHNEREQDFPLPKGWSATVYPPHETPALSTEEIREAFAHPVAAEPICRAARGAQTAVVLVDDFRRPTPAETLCEVVIDELNAAGLPAEQISIVMANGAHRPMTRPEIRTRLGRVLDRVGTVVSHDAFSPDAEFKGITSAGTPVLVNPIAARADFSIAISTVYPHALAAWAGGGKMVLPGISHLSTIDLHHRRIKGGEWGGNPGACPSRRDIEEAAKLFGLDVAVCSVLNARRELCGLRVGSPTQAHRRAVTVARRAYATDITGASADLVISNAYPLDADPTQLSKAQLPARPFGAPVLILADFADPSPYHGLYDGPLAPYRRRPPVEPPKHTDDLLHSAKVFMYCPQYGKGYVPTDRTWYCDNDWDRLMKAMAKRFPRASVAVLPAAPFQIPTTDCRAASRS